MRNILFISNTYKILNYIFDEDGAYYQNFNLNDKVLFYSKLF